GIMTEASLTRINEDEFFLICPMAGEERDMHWLQQHADGYDVEITNLTDKLASVLLTGPKAREILQAISRSDLSQKAFPWLTT
ncbi:MAG: dimethylglycine dehydrogenase, partial [Arenicella sp.]